MFKKIYAGAPGVMQPIEANGKPAIFISHGRQDQTMPIDETSRKFVPRLKALGYDVTYDEYDARHQLPPEELRKVVECSTRAGQPIFLNPANSRARRTMVPTANG